MQVLTVGLSHSPLIGLNDPAPEVVAEVEEAVGKTRTAVLDFAPEIVIMFAPDHYNGFFYKTMPSFCLAREAHAVGDFTSAEGPLAVDAEAADILGRGVLERGVDLAFSGRMTVDHGFAQPLEVLFGGLDAVACVPIFINSVATPLGPMSRIRLLGEAVGQAAGELGKERVLFVASGGLSHDPPVPVLQGAPPPVANALIEGTPPTPEQRKRGEDRVVKAGVEYAAGTSPRLPLNEEWDNRVLDLCAGGDVAGFDSWSVDDISREGGGSGHEIRSWVAAFAAMGACGEYEMDHRYYRAIPEWVAGFATATARPR